MNIAFPFLVQTMFIFTVPSKFQKRHESSITEVICYSDILFLILISYIEGSAEIAIMLVLLIIVLRLAMMEMEMQPLFSPIESQVDLQYTQKWYFQLQYILLDLQ